MPIDSNEVIQSFRVDRDLRKIFQQVCQDNDMTASQVLRQFMRDYVSKNSQGKMFGKFDK
jgi:antitoxin component of RelBE/YafQ-DinJ toxin-antitoxin module